MYSLSDNLTCCYCQLDDWQLVAVKGPDAVKYLQGQLTNDICQLDQQHSQFAAHCDPKGKVLSNMLLFQQNDTIYYLLRRSVAEMQIADLKKYAIFSKVEIEPTNQLCLLGVAGQQAETVLSQLFTQLPDAQHNVLQQQSVTIIRLPQPQPRFILIAEQTQLEQVSNQLSALKVTASDSQQWLALDIEAGYAIIDAANFLQLIPQAFSLEKIAGISFDKGCYRGQETVARAHYRGINKRALYSLMGNSTTLPEIGDALEQQMDKNWRASGRVLAAVQLNPQQILVQAVLSHDLEPQTQFRIKNQPDSRLQLK